MSAPQFAALYSFQVINEAEFIEAWKALTQLIYQYEGSYGSKLHKAGDGVFVAYAQWKDKAAWENSGGNLPETAAALRQKMRAACSEFKTVYELEVVENLLQEKPFMSHQ